MPDLTFDILSAQAKPYAVVPTLAFELRVTNAVPAEEVFAAALKCQVMIEAVHRGYDAGTQERLSEVFGAPARWDETLNSLLWTSIAVPLPRFLGSTTVEITIPCGEDVELAAGKYFSAVRDGSVPLAFLFSGTIFYKGPATGLQVAQVPWEKEAAFKLPSQTWHDLIESYYPGTRWLRLSRETFDKLQRYKAAAALPTFDHCLEKLLTQLEEATWR
jgi:hypothetical protein